MGMTNEATTSEWPRVVKRFQVSTLVAIPKGTILKLSGDNTAIASSASDVFAGIAVEEKSADSVITDIGAATDGVFELTTDVSAITLGAMVVLSGANVIRAAVAADLLTGKIIGKALEAASAGEVIRVLVGSN